MKTLTHAERLDWLRLIRTENVGPVTFARLLARFGTPGAAIDALPQLSTQSGRKLPLKAVSRAEAEAEFERANRCGARPLALCEPDYPRPLAAIPGAPPTC